MQVSINPKVNQIVESFYRKNYEIIPTPNLDNIRLLKKDKYKKAIYFGSNKKIRTCRFCGKSEPTVTFRKKAHVFPESIGNKILFSNYECDFCNEFFGNGIENEYGNFFQFYHTLSGISGKRGIPKLKSSHGQLDLQGNFIPDFEMFWHTDETGHKYFNVINNIPLEKLESSSKTITIEEKIPTFRPISVFKAITKMAITVLPFHELNLFKNTITWLLETEQRNIYKSKKLLVRHVMIPGFNVPKYPHFIIYKRKKTCWNYPYMLFNLTYGLFSLLIEIPRDNSNTQYDFHDIPFPYIPFFTSSEGYWDLSDHLPKDYYTHSVNLTYGEKYEITKSVTMGYEKGKRKISVPSNILGSIINMGEIKYKKVYQKYSAK